MRHLWDGSSKFHSAPKTYATYANAVKAAQKIIGERDISVIIAASHDGRFFPVAIGEKAVGLHFYMCIAA